MSQEKYQFQPPKRSAEDKLNQVQRYSWRIIARIVGAIEKKYGQEGLDTIHDALVNWDNHRSSVIKSGVIPGQGTLKDLIFKVFDPAMDMSFTFKQLRTVTEAPDEDRLLYTIPECNVADAIARECPKTCAVVARALEKGLAAQVNPNIKVSGDQWLSTGHDGCRIYFEMTKANQEQKE